MKKAPGGVLVYQFVNWLSEQWSHVVFKLLASILSEYLHFFLCDDDIITVCSHLVITCLCDTFVCDIILV